MKKTIIALFTVLACMPAMAQTTKSGNNSKGSQAACPTSLIADWQSKKPFNAEGFCSNAMDVTEIKTPTDPITVVLEGNLTIEQLHKNMDRYIKDWDTYVKIIAEGEDVNKLAKACYNLQIPFAIEYKSLIDGESIITPFSLKDIEEMVKVNL